MAEENIWEERPSYMAFLGKLIIGGLLVSIGIVVVLFYRMYIGLGIGCFLLGCCFFIYILIERFSMLYTLTNERVIMQIGLIAKNTREVELKDIRDITVKQGIIARLLKIGDVFISSAGGPGAEVVFLAINNPHEIKEKIRNLRKD